jgi:hypothetical protein
MHDKIMFMHIPKCAGTSMEKFFYDYLGVSNGISREGDRVFFTLYDPCEYANSYPARYDDTYSKMGYYYKEIPYFSPNSVKKDIFNHYVNQVAPIDPNFSKFFLTGHYTPFKYLDLENPKNTEDIFLFTFLRNPLDRLKSLYAHYTNERIKKNNEVKDLLYVMFKNENMSFEEFVLHPCSLNFQSDMMHYVPIERFNFIGLFENLQNDWKILCQMLEVEYSPLPVKNKNNNKIDIKVSKDLQNKIEDYHWRDYCLYDRVRRQKQLA